MDRIVIFRGFYGKVILVSKRDNWGNEEEF